MNKLFAASFALFLAAIAGCASQPAMQASHIALLHSGEILVAVPDRPFFTLVSPRRLSASQEARVATAAIMGGAIGGAILYAAGGLGHNGNQLEGIDALHQPDKRN